ncbi:MAG: hypothetical protein U1F46_08405 [Marinagarivorans sp.]
MKTLSRYFELLFWGTAACLMAVAAYSLMLKGMYSLWLDINAIKEVLTQEIFFALITFELFLIARIRIEKRSNEHVLYHFIFMSTLTLGREIFLIHNLSLWIVTGFALMVCVYVLYGYWRRKFLFPIVPT